MRMRFPALRTLPCSTVATCNVSPSAVLQEVRERAQIADVEQLTHVALHVGGHVVREPLMRWNLTIEDARVRTRPQHLEQVGRRRWKSLQLTPARRIKLEQSGATGE